jgi:hypothetical protein
MLKKKPLKMRCRLTSLTESTGETGTYWIAAMEITTSTKEEPANNVKMKLMALRL